MGALLVSTTVLTMAAVTSWPYAVWNVPVAATSRRTKQQNTNDGRLITTLLDPKKEDGDMLYSGTRMLVKKKMRSDAIFLIDLHYLKNNLSEMPTARRAAHLIQKMCRV